MLLAYSCYAGNYELAKHTLSHALSLDGPVGYDFLLVHPEDFDASELLEMLTGYGRKVTELKHEPAEAWPLGKNFAWQAVARHLFETGSEQQWLWWEPDAVPVKKGWIQAIEAEAKDATVLACQNNSGYFDGVAVYPPRVLELSMAAMMCRAAPFDQVAGRDLTGLIKPSKCIKSVWDINGLPPSFNSKEQAIKLIGDAYLFHRCKDGTLTQALNETILDKALNGLKRLVGGIEQKKSKTCVVMLGRYGDIVNVLPVCRHLAETEGVPGLVVSEQFKDLLDGVSYVDPIIFKGQFTDLKEGIALAKSRYDKVLVGQVNSRNVGVNTECVSFNQESWRQMGYLPDFGKLPLMFDKRDYDREKALVQRYKLTDKPLLLTCMTGKSSPFEDAQRLTAHLQAKWGERFEIVEIGQIKAERIYDLLGLMDEAACLISIDTAALHLSMASHVPLIALLAEKPTLWHGSTPKPGTLLARRYSEVMGYLHEIDACLSKLANFKSAMPRFTMQTEWKCGQFPLPLNKDVSHFNPGMVRDGAGQLWMLARKSARNSEGKWNSTLLACKLTDDLRITETIDVKIPRCKFQQHEDPRVIWKNNRFYVTFCGWSRKPKMAPKQLLAIFNANWQNEGLIQPQFANNLSGSLGVEKNWALFGHGGSFHFIYQFRPHIVVQMNGEIGLVQHLSDPKVSWNYGEVRGGTPPVQVGDEYITFFHSSLHWRNGQRRYYMGAYAFEAKAPFNVTRITKEPLLVGSENDTRIHGGPPVVFPCGALLENGEWLISFGVNDEACGWIRIPQKELEQKLCT